MLDLRATLDKLLELQARGGSGVSVGTITEYAGTFPPDGWMLCDGRTLSRTVYAELFNEIGTTWGAGDGSTTFNIPDLRDKFSVGTGGLYSLTNSGGNKDSIVPYHNHSVNAVTSGGPSNNTSGAASPGTSSNGDHEGHLNSNTGCMYVGNTTWFLPNSAGQYYGSSGRGWRVENGNEMRPHAVTRGAHSHTVNSHTHSLQSHTHSVPSHSTEYVGTSGNLTNANLPPYLAMNFIIFTGVFQTLAAQTTWTLLEDRIQNSQLTIPIPSIFDEPITIDDDIKIKINQNVTTGVDRDLNAALANLGWSDLINNSEITFKGILSRMARGGAIAGTIMEYAGAFPPDGWIICDGRELSRTVYEELFDAIGTTYGSGDGSTTFNIPDLRGRVSIGSDGTYALGSSGGEKNHTLTLNEAPAHTHTRGTMNITGNCSPAHSSGVCWYNVTGCSGAFYSNSSVSNCGKPTLGNGTFTGDHMLGFDASRNWTGATSSAGGGEAHNNMQPYLTVQMIIFTGVYQTVAAATTWTSLQNRISNSQLNIPVVTNFGDTVNFQGNNFSITNPTAFKSAIGLSPILARASYRASGDVQFTGWIPFNTVEYNIGGGSFSSGAYVCPVDGVYLANFTCFSNQPTEGRACLKADDHEMSMVNQNQSTSITGVYNMKAGKKIYAGCYNTNYPIRIYAGGGHNSFTIVRIA